MNSAMLNVILSESAGGEEFLFRRARILECEKIFTAILKIKKIKEGIRP